VVEGAAEVEEHSTGAWASPLRTRTLVVHHGGTTAVAQVPRAPRHRVRLPGGAS